MHLLGRRASTHFCLVAELRGTFDAGSLAAATRQVVAEHPLLGVRIGRGPGGHLAFLSGGAVAVPRIHRRPPADWPSAAAREIASPIGEDGSAPFRITALVEDGAAALVLTFHHSVADGRSAVAVLEDLLSALAGRAGGRGDAPPSLERRAGLDAAGEDGPAPGDEVLERGPVLDPAPSVNAAVLDAVETAALISASRANGATVNGALCAALAHVPIPRRSAPATAVLNAVDFRPLLGARERPCAFLVGGVEIRIEAGADFWTSARAASREGASARRPEFLRQRFEALSAALPSDAGPSAAAAMYDGPIGADVTLTNLGALSTGRVWGGLEIAALWGPVVWHSPRRTPVLSALGFGGSIGLVETASPAAESLLGAVRATLVAVAAQG